MQLTPHWWQPPKPAICFSLSHCDPRPSLASMKMVWWTGPWEVTLAVPFLNPDLIAHLVGWSNEAPIIVDGQRVTALIDLGAQVSSVSSGFCKWMALKVHSLDKLLELEGTRGSAFPCLRYVEVNLQIPGIRDYNEDILLWSYWPKPILRRYQSWWGPRLLIRWWEWLQRGISEGNCNLETGPL